MEDAGREYLAALYTLCARPLRAHTIPVLTAIIAILQHTCIYFTTAIAVMATGPTWADAEEAQFLGK